MNRTILGLIIVGVVALVAVAATQLDLGPLTRQLERRAPVTVTLYYGGEKSALLANPEIGRILSDRYRVTLDATKAGSVEMVTTLPATGKDCLWPSTAVAEELARSSGRNVLSSDNVFNSPIVFFAWAEVADALIAQGAVSRRNDGTLTADVAAIGRLVDTGARWKEDLGVNVYGRFRIFSTDPVKSNSGNIWAALLATMLNGGEVPTAADLPTLLPRLDAHFAEMGYMESSSGDIFENFLKQGMGARPIIVGYENQLVEFLTGNARYADLIRQKIRPIYPEPTIFASHPLIALTPACKRLSEALMDVEVQRIAWAQHGFRTGLIGVQNDPADITVASLPEQVSLVIPMPAAEVMARIIATLEAR